jgi:hypothetical protein
MLFWFWFLLWPSLLFSSLECSVQRQGVGHFERERRTLAAELQARLGLRRLPQAKTFFGEKR